MNCLMGKKTTVKLSQILFTFSCLGYFWGFTQRALYMPDGIFDDFFSKENTIVIFVVVMTAVRTTASLPQCWQFCTGPEG